MYSVQVYSFPNNIKAQLRKPRMIQKVQIKKDSITSSFRPTNGYYFSVKNRICLTRFQRKRQTKLLKVHCLVSNIVDWLFALSFGELFMRFFSWGLFIIVIILASSFGWIVIIGSDLNFLFVDIERLTSRKIMTRIKFPSRTALQIDTKFTLREFVSRLGNSSDTLLISKFYWDIDGRR